MITVDRPVAETTKPTKRLRWDATSPQSVIINNGYTDTNDCTCIAELAKCPMI